MKHNISALMIIYGFCHACRLIKDVTMEETRDVSYDESD